MSLFLCICKSVCPKFVNATPLLTTWLLCFEQFYGSYWTFNVFFYTLLLWTQLDRFPSSFIALLDTLCGWSQGPAILFPTILWNFTYYTIRTLCGCNSSETAQILFNFCRIVNHFMHLIILALLTDLTNLTGTIGLTWICTHCGRNSSETAERILFKFCIIDSPNM